MQGELLRQAEKLRNESCGNGNINWDDNFEWFCKFIGETLILSNLFDDKEFYIITNALKNIKQCGIYAKRYSDGEIPEDEVNPSPFAYVDDDLYDYIEDAIAEFTMKNKKPIPYEAKDFIYR